jgi:hypothetical protein
MSSTSEHISPGLFVVRPASPTTQTDGLSGLDGLASVKPLGGRTPGWVVKLNKSPKSARAGWRDLHRLLGPDFVVLPAMVDDAGHYRYPTGLLSLRFDNDASEQKLQSVATTYGLEFVGRAKFTRQQALFKPAGGSNVFLPDVSGKIQDDEQIEAVWFDAESAFSRS